MSQQEEDRTKEKLRRTSRGRKGLKDQSACSLSKVVESNSSRNHIALTNRTRATQAFNTCPPTSW